MITSEQNVLNANIPNLKLKVRRSWLTKNEADNKTFDSCYAFAVQSVAGKILTFHIMTDYGMLRSRVPISELFYHEPTADIPSDFKQLWDCFSENVSVIEYLYLADDGYMLCQPNNRIYWKDSNFITNKFPVDPKEFKVDTSLECVESESDRWVSTNGDCFYYDIEETQTK